MDGCDMPLPVRQLREARRTEETIVRPLTGMGQHVVRITLTSEPCRANLPLMYLQATVSIHM